jgi:hypothetical protein
MVRLACAGKLGVRRLPGQATIGAAMLLHRACTLVITLAVLLGVGIAAMSWRLSQGPVDLPWLASRLEEAANANGGPTRLAIGSVALNWEGFRLGVDSPLDLRLTNVTVIDQSGRRRMDIPRAEVSLSLYGLILGRIEPRVVVIDGPRLTLLRAADGTLSLDLGSLTEATDNGEPAPAGPAATDATPIADLLAVLAKPPTADRDRTSNALLGRLRVVRVRDARVAMVDRQFGTTLRAPQAQIDLTRRPGGGVDGTADLTLVLGEQRARLTTSATLAAGATGTHLRARLTPVTPGVLAQAVPTLTMLSALDAPVGIEADLDLDASLAVREGRVTLRAAAGEVRLGNGVVPIANAVLVASGTPEAIALQTLRVSLIGHPGGQPTIVETHGTLQREAGRLNAAVSIDLDQADFADLGRLWPEGIASDTRTWLVENIPAGMARDGHVDIGLAASQDLSSVALTRASGTLDGDGLQVFWLRPVPPIDNGQAQLRILDPDTLEIAVTSGRQKLRNQKDSAAGLQIRSGRMRITGLTQKDQFSTIDADVAGSVPDVLALLHEPRLGLLDRHPIDLKNPAGQATMKLSVVLPLDKKVTMNDIAIHTQGRLDGVHLGAVVAGRDVDQGVFDLDATNDGLKANGRALLASIPARLDVAMDFRGGPPTQVVQSITASGQPDARQLASAGLDATAVLAGPMQLQANLTEHRNGQGQVAITADLTSAELAVPSLEWRKPRDAPAKASVQMALDHDRLVGIGNIQLDGDGVGVRASADVKDARITLVRVDRGMLGRTDLHGTVKLPDPSGGGPIVADIAGSTIDLAPRLAHRSPARKPVQPKVEPPPGPPWTVAARFDRALMANGETISQLAISAENDGRVIQRLRVDGQTGSHAPFLMQIVPDKAGRRFTASAGDAGQLLHGLDLVNSMQGGRLSVQAHYDDARQDRPLSGTANIEEFRIRDAPALGKLLQAMTLYGLVEVMQGAGLGFSRMVAPFQLTDDALNLTDARAFSSSLGLTMKGKIDLDAEQLDMQGTIVPAYFFNALLGNIPLVGKLFSPERGGGVFAASYTLHGPLNDPEVFVNPLTALTPGFLRGLFGIF